MILCCGEALIDMLPRANDAGETTYLPVAGGAIFNTAIALGRMGENAGFFSGLSSDQFGRLLVKTLQDSGVDSRYCAVSDRLTTLAFVELNDGQASYTFYDEGSAGRMLAEADLPALPDEVRALHFGAISLIPEPCGSAFEALMAREAAKRVISFDPNIRPGFITDVGKHRARIDRMIGCSDIVKVSDEDMAWIAPDGDPASIARKWLARGVSVVLLTKGALGVTAICNGGEISQPAILAEVVDTVGAGDTFNAGFLSELRTNGLLTKTTLKTVEPSALAPALEKAAKVAAVTVSRAGANPPWERELG